MKSLPALFLALAGAVGASCAFCALPAASAAEPVPEPAPFPPADGRLIDRLIAVVNTEPITLFELHRAAAPYVAKVVTESRPEEVPAQLEQVQAEVLDNLINDLLVYAQAKDLGLTVPPEKIDEHVERIRAANGWTIDELAEQLRRLGFASLADYRRHTEREMLKSNAISIKVGSRVKIDEKDVDAEAQKRLGAGNTVEERRALHILLVVDALASGDASEAIRLRLQETRERILSGAESFEEAARRMSEDAGTRPAGGDVSWFVQGDFDPDFEQAAFALAVDEISQPIRTQFGWHLVKVIAVRDRRVEGDEDVEKLKREVRFRMRQQELERLYLQWVKGLRSQAFIEVKDSKYKRQAGADTTARPRS